MSVEIETLSVAIIDPVGTKAGMDHYDHLLLQGLQQAGVEVRLYSNFSRSLDKVNVQQVFFNTEVSKLSAVLSNFGGYIKALRLSKKNKVKWLLLHVFRAGVFDLFMLSLARIMGFRICAVIHDVESLDTYTLPFIRKLVISNLPNIRVVHNDFSKKELGRSIGKKAKVNTYVIPHVNFIPLFTNKNIPENRQEILEGLSTDLPVILKQNIPVFLFFGQIKKAKGIDVLLEAMSLLKTDCRLVIAGKPRDNSWSYSQQLIRVLKLQGKVLSIIRHISSEERDLLFSETIAVVLPYSKIYQSGVLLMAMSFPTLVLASDLPPNRDIIKDGVNGILFTTGSSKDLATRMQAVLDKQTDNTLIKSAALARMHEGFSPEKIGKDYFRLLKSIK